MKIDANKIMSLSDKFLGVFFILSKEEKFIECFLGLIYCMRNIYNFSLKTNIYTQEQIDKIIFEIFSAADKNFDENYKAIENIIKLVKEKEGEEK